MIVSLDEAKLYLRLETDYKDEDVLIQTLIDTAEESVKNATGITFDSTNNLAKLYVIILVADFYDNRSTLQDLKTKTRTTLESIILQLQYCYRS